MSDDEIVLTEPDAFGRHWVYVTGAEVQAHPKGRLGIGEYAIALWFAAIAAFEASVNLAFGAFGIVPALFTGLLIICSVGIVMRAPWALVLSILLAVREAFGFVQLIGGGAFQVPPLLALYGVTNAIIAIGIIFYMIEGDRPNFIFRHRYRSYRAEAQERKK